MICAFLPAALLAAVALAASSASASDAPAFFQVAANHVFAWGNNEQGQLGDGTATERDAPVQLAALPVNAQQVVVSGSAEFSAALLADGTVTAWGTGFDGQLGNDSTFSSYVPRQVLNLTAITQISAGGDFMLAVGAGGTVWSWGGNSSGQLGNGTAGSGTNTDVPGQVPGLSGVVQVAAGDDYSLALRSDGTVWAWGNNANGQLGDHTTVSRDLPEHVPGLTGIVQVASAGTSYAVRSDGTLFSWGGNYDGLLGNGSTATYSTAAVAVPNLSAVTQVASSGFTTLVIAGTNGRVWAWGNNTAGEIGDGTTTSQLTPEPLTLTGITLVSSGFYVSAAVRSDGTLLTWGDNGLGELGIGAASYPSYTPVAVPSLIGVSRVAMSNGYGLAIGRSAYAAVPNVYGQSSAAASTNLQAAGFVLGAVGSVVDNTCNNIGRVISQNPPAGTAARIGSAVSVTIGVRPRNPCP